MNENDQYRRDKYKRTPKEILITMLLSTQDRENEFRQLYLDKTASLHKLEEDFARKTSDLELSMRRELELRTGNESLVNQRTNALNDAESWRKMVDTERRRADQEKALREQMEQRLADMRMMVDLVKTVAGRE